ncbi:MAG: hypothetical protein J1F60_10430 [Oscillospiraceae bacterium]|nr:hypothetical protein [Oscillospiraceae bacterium]
MTLKEASEKWDISEHDLRLLCSWKKVAFAYFSNGEWAIPDNAPEPVYDKDKPATFYTKSYPKGDGSNKWIVEQGDYYIGGKRVPKRYVECEESECPFVEYQLSC